jgi:hypothetical protein
MSGGPQVRWSKAHYKRSSGDALFLNVKHRRSTNKGSPPKEIFYKEVFDGLSEQEGLKNVLFNEIERIQDKIERMVKSNRKRFAQYRTTLKISLLFVATAIFIIVRAIYN